MGSLKLYHDVKSYITSMHTFSINLFLRKILMSTRKTADVIEESVETIKETITHLKKKDEEILDILLKTKSLLDRQKIEDIKLTVS